MVRAAGRPEHPPHTHRGTPAMHTLRASAIALPFLGLAALVWALSMLIGPVR